MNRQELDHQMEQVLGARLSLMDQIADEFVAAEWCLVRSIQFGETLIPQKYKQLIALAVAAVTRCPYGVVLHDQLARVHGASTAEVGEAVHWARLASGWGAHLAGLQVDPKDFADEVRTVASRLVERLGAET